MGQITDALAESLKIGKVPPASAATVALSRKYARLLDNAAPNARYRRALALLGKVFEHYEETVRLTPVDQRALEEAENMITVALGEHSVASDIGPKFLAALQTLGLTLPSTGTGGGTIDNGGADDELAALRQERRDRERRA